MCKLKIPKNKKAGGVSLGPQRPAIRQSSKYQFLKYMSSPKNSNHKFFITQGRRVFEKPANWSERIRQ